MNTFNTFYWIIAKNQGRGLNGESFANLDEIFAYSNKVVAPFIHYDKDFDRVFEKLRTRNTSFTESELLLLLEFLFILRRNGINALITNCVEYLKSVFWQNLPVLSNSTIRFELCHTICSFERESGNTETSMNFLKEGIKDILNTLKDEQQIKYYFALGNSSKDIGKYPEAIAFYQKAQNLAEKTQDVEKKLKNGFLSGIYHQLSTYYSEVGLYEQQKLYMDKLEAIPEGEVVEELEIYRKWYHYINKSTYFRNTGNVLEGVMHLSEVLPQFRQRDKYFYPMEWQLIGSYESFLQTLSLNNYGEWAKLLSLIPAKLSGEKRQIAMLFSSVSKQLVYRQQGGEFMFFVSEADKLLQESQNKYLHANSFANLAFSYYAVGMRDKGVKLMRNAVDLIKKSDKNNVSLLNLNSQLSLMSYGSTQNAKIHAESIQEIAELLRSNQYNLTNKRQLGFLASTDLLKSKPESLLTWYEKLRTSKDKFPDDFDYLNFIVNNFDEQIKSYPNGKAMAEGADKAVGGKQTYAKGAILSLICNKGFLERFKNDGGLQSYYVLEWILSKSQNATISNRIIAEYFSNPLMLNDYERKRGDESIKEHLQQMPMLRALIMKYFFLEKMQLTNEVKYKEYAKIATRSLETFYEKWKRTPVITVERLVEELKKLDPTSTGKTDTSKINSQTTAMDLGIHLDNYLNRSLFFKIAELKKSGTEMPVLLDLIQFDDFACWLIFDTSVKDILKDGTKYEKVFISKQEADKITKSIYGYIEKNEINTKTDSFLQEISEIINLLTPLIKHIEKDRIVYANFGGAWAGIPLENIPFTTNEDTLLDMYQISRRLLRKDDWLYYKERALKSQNGKFAWIAGDAQNNLPYAKESLDQIGKWLNTKPILGEEFTYEKFVSTIEGNKIIHIENHGKIFRTAEGAYWSYLTLSNNDIIGQEIAALDLSEAELVFVAACNSADVKSIGNAHSDTIGSYFALAGAKSVIASITQIGDERAKELVSIFYQKILVERLSLSLALRETLSKENRKKYNFHISPLVLMGNNKTIHIQ